MVNGGIRDAFVPLTAMAGTIKTARVGTGIAQMARPPVLTALSALSLAEYTGGRFVLGVGTAPRDWNINWHGFDVPHPVPRIREYIECIRTVLTATTTNPIDYTGTYYQVRDYIQFLAPPITEIPIYLAGVHSTGRNISRKSSVQISRKVLGAQISTDALSRLAPDERNQGRAGRQPYEGGRPDTISRTVHPSDVEHRCSDCGYDLGRHTSAASAEEFRRHPSRGHRAERQSRSRPYRFSSTPVV